VAAPFTITVSATGSCWVQTRNSRNGSILYQSLLSTGQTVAFQVIDQLWIRLGSAQAVNVRAGGKPVPLARLGPNPYDLTFIGLPTGAPTARIR
jgi:hypothetical protein